MFSGTKLDETFPNQQLKIRDRNKHGWGIMFYIIENIPCKTVNVEGLPDDCEVTLIELSIKSRKWLSIGFYKRPSQNEKYFLDNLEKIFIFQKSDDLDKKTIALSVLYLMCQRFLKESVTTKLRLSFKINCQTY